LCLNAMSVFMSWVITAVVSEGKPFVLQM
jgi:hypothetical protein